jgi:hypothetical protein
MSTKTLDYLAEQRALKRLVLEPQVVELVSTFIARAMSGKARAGAEPCSIVKDFLSRNAENCQLFGKLVQVAKLDCTPEEFADFADNNYDLQNGEPEDARRGPKSRCIIPSMHTGNDHNSLDEALVKKAKQLKAAGAIRVLHRELGWECSILENMEELVKCLNKTS